MVELELKYKLKRFPDKLLDFEISQEKTQVDIYYDTPKYDLIKAGNFLRIRDDKKLDFKTNLDDATHLYCKETSFLIKEIEQKQKEINNVLRVIGLPSDQSYNNFDSFIQINEFIVLAPIKKIRKTYKVEENFTVYIDEVENMGLFLEAEYVIEAEDISPEEAQTHKKRMNEFLLTNNIISNDDEAVNIGYVELYLKEHNREVYEMGLYKS